MMCLLVGITISAKILQGVCYVKEESQKES